MLFVELATQSVKGFSPSSRAPLKPGYNVLVPPGAAPQGLVPLLAALLYNDGRGGDAELAAASGARAALTLQGSDGRTYRLVRALGGAGVLHRLEPNNTWATVSQDAAEITQFLRGACGLPTRGLFEELFSFTAASMPSRRPAEPAAAASPAAGPGLGRGQAPSLPTALRPNALVEAAMAAVSARPKLDPEKARQDLERLRAEVAAGKELDEQQYQLEGMQQRIFELEEKLKKLDKLVEDVETARGSLTTTHTIESLGLPPDALVRASRYDEAVKKRDEAIARLREEEHAAKERAEASQPQPVWRDQQFLIALGVGVLLFVLGIIFRGSAVGYLALLDIPAFGFAGLCALRWIGELQEADALQRKLVMNQGREQKINGDFDNEYFPIKAAMRMIGVETGKEFIEFFGRQQAITESLKAAEARLQAARNDPELISALDEQDALTVQAKQLEARIAEMGAGLTRDWREAEREIQEIEAALAGGDGGGGAVAQGGSIEAAAASEEPPAKEDPVPRVLSLAQDLFAGASLEALGGMMRDRMAQYIVALTDRRYVGVKLDARGRATLIAPGREVAAGALSDLDLDILYLAAKMTVVEKHAATGKVPVVLDEPFVGWDEPKQQLLSRMLKHIGTATQVVHASALPAHRAVADSAVQI